MENCISKEELKLFCQSASYSEKSQAYPKLMKRALENPEDEVDLSFLYQLNTGIFNENLIAILTEKKEDIKNLQNFFEINIKDPALLLKLYLIYKDLDETQKEMKEFLLKEIKKVTVADIESEDYSILKIYFNFKKDSDTDLNSFAEDCLKAFVFKEMGLDSTLSEMAKEQESISDIIDFCDKAVWADAIIPCRALSKIEKNNLPAEKASDKKIKEFLDLKEILEGISLKIIEKYPIMDVDKVKPLFDMTWRMKALYTQYKEHAVQKETMNAISRIFFENRNDCDLEAFYNLLKIIDQKNPDEAKFIPSLVDKEIERHEELQEDKSEIVQNIIALCLDIYVKNKHDNKPFSLLKKAISLKTRNPLERENLRRSFDKYTSYQSHADYIISTDKKISIPKENIKNFLDAWWLNKDDWSIDHFTRLITLMKLYNIPETFFQNDKTFQFWKEELTKKEDEESREKEELQSIRQRIANLPE